MLGQIALAGIVMLAQSLALEGTSPAGAWTNGAVTGWLDVTPNPCANWCPYDVYFKLHNGTDSAVTVFKITDNGDSIWGGNAAVLPHEAQTIRYGHGDHAVPGTYVHHPVFYTSVGQVIAPVYTVVVLSSGICGWVDVQPNPCAAGEPYDVYYKLYGAGGLTVNRITDNGDSVWAGSMTVPGTGPVVVHQLHEASAEAGTWVHSPVFYASIVGSEYTFCVNPYTGLTESPEVPGLDGRNLTCTPSVAAGTGMGISFAVSVRARTRVEIVDVLGCQLKTVLNDILVPGKYHVTWDRTDRYGQKVPAGTYICRLTAGDETFEQKLLLVD